MNLSLNFLTFEASFGRDLTDIVNIEYHTYVGVVQACPESGGQVEVISVMLVARFLCLGRATSSDLLRTAG